MLLSTSVKYNMSQRKYENRPFLLKPLYPAVECTNDSQTLPPPAPTTQALSLNQKQTSTTPKSPPSKPWHPHIDLLSSLSTIVGIHTFSVSIHSRTVLSSPFSLFFLLSSPSLSGLLHPPYLPSFLASFLASALVFFFHGSIFPSSDKMLPSDMPRPGLELGDVLLQRERTEMIWERERERKRGRRGKTAAHAIAAQLGLAPRQGLAESTLIIRVRCVLWRV